MGSYAIKADNYSLARRCEHLELVLAPGKGPHAASFRCKSCGAFCGWCSKNLLTDLQQGAFTDALQAAADRGCDPAGD